MTHQTRVEIAQELNIPIERVCIVGSTLICGEGNDLDVLCLLDDPEAPSIHGFEPDLKICRYDSNFASWRRRDLNLLVTTDPSYFASEITIAYAAAVFKDGHYDLAERDGRVHFHQLVRAHVAMHLDDPNAMKVATDLDSLLA